MTDTPKYEIHVDKAYVSPKSAAEWLSEMHYIKVRLYMAHDKAVRYCRSGIGDEELYENARADFDEALMAFDKTLDSAVEAARGEATVTANQQAASVYQTLGVAEQAAFRRGAREAALRIMNARLWTYEAQQICQEYADSQPEERKP